MAFKLTPSTKEEEILSVITKNWGSRHLLFPLMADNGNHMVNMEITQDDLVELIRKKAKEATKK
jgi:hypothetical protein